MVEPPVRLLHRQRAELDLRERDIEVHLAEIYGVKVGRDLISRVTDAVMDDVREWAKRPREDIYPIVFLDCMVHADLGAPGISPKPQINQRENVRIAVNERSPPPSRPADRPGRRNHGPRVDAGQIAREPADGHHPMRRHLSQVLRHSDLATTAIYAKVDLGRLRQVSRPWPGAAR